MKDANMYFKIMMIGTILATTAVSAPLWPAYRYDRQQTGHCPYVGPETADTLWSFWTGDTMIIRNAAPVIGEDTTIYFGSRDSFLFAVRPDGQEKWRYKTDGTPGFPAIDEHGRIYVAVSNCEVLALDDSATYGKLAWSWGPGDTVVSTAPVIIGYDGTVYATFDSMYALDSAGTRKWAVNRGETAGMPPAISRDGQFLYFECIPNQYNVALRKTDLNANPLWTRIIGGVPDAFTWGSTAIGLDSTVYYASGMGTIFALRPNNTDKFPPISGLGSANVNTALTLGSADTLWYMNRGQDPKYWKFEPDNGNLVFEDSVVESPWYENLMGCFITDGLGQAYIYLRDSMQYYATLFAFNADGSVKWTFPFPQSIRCTRSVPVISPNGTLYIISGNKLYAFNNSYGVTENVVADNRDLTISIIPNPCPGKANIRLTVARGTKIKSVKIYNKIGQMVAILHDSDAEARTEEFIWNGRDRHGRLVESGVYFCRVETAAGVSQTKKLVIQR